MYAQLGTLVVPRSDRMLTPSARALRDVALMLGSAVPIAGFRTGLHEAGQILLTGDTQTSFPREEAGEAPRLLANIGFGGPLWRTFVSLPW
jgi:hypothetical protein